MGKPSALPKNSEYLDLALVGRQLPPARTGHPFRRMKRRSFSAIVEDLTGLLAIGAAVGLWTAFLLFLF